MSIERLKHDYTFDETTFEVSCDDCLESEEVEGSFDDCRDWMKENNWRTFWKDGEGFVNLCTHCKNLPENQPGYVKPNDPRA